MSDSVNEVLRGIVERHGQVLLDDHRRCESCLRDTPLAPKEIAGVMAALRAGIPKRLSAMPAIGDKGIANFAAELSDSSGLSEQLALTSVAAWAFALQPQRVEKYEKKDDKKAMQQDETAVSKASVPSLSEAIVAAIVIPVICYGAYVFGTFKVFGFEVPAWIFALIVVVKGGQSIGSYLSFRFGMKA